MTSGSSDEFNEKKAQLQCRSNNNPLATWACWAALKTQHNPTHTCLHGLHGLNNGLGAAGAWGLLQRSCQSYRGHLCGLSTRLLYNYCIGYGVCTLPPIALILGMWDGGGVQYPGYAGLIFSPDPRLGRAHSESDLRGRLGSDRGLSLEEGGGEGGQPGSLGKGSPAMQPCFNGGSLQVGRRRSLSKRQCQHLPRVHTNVTEHWPTLRPCPSQTIDPPPSTAAHVQLATSSYLLVVLSNPIDCTKSIRRSHRSQNHPDGSSIACAISEHDHGRLTGGAITPVATCPRPPKTPVPVRVRIPSPLPPASAGTVLWLWLSGLFPIHAIAIRKKTTQLQLGLFKFL